MKPIASSRLARDDPWHAVALAKADRGLLVAAWIRRLMSTPARKIGFRRVLVQRFHGTAPTRSSDP